MLLDVMTHYRLTKDFRNVGFFETAHHKQIFKQMKTAIPLGQLIALSGVIGVGKTKTLMQLQEILKKDNKVIVSKSLSVEKSKTNLSTLIMALFFDVTGDNDYKVPKQGEKRERELQELIRSTKKTVVLFVDEAHDLHHHTLTGLKRLMEVIVDGGGKLSIVLAGHPKLRNDLKGPNMEEIGYRAIAISLDGMKSNLKDYVQWLLKNCTEEKAKSSDVITARAIDYMVEKLSTPLQIEQHLTLALEEAFRIGGKPVDVDILDITLSKRINDLEPTLHSPWV